MSCSVDLDVRQDLGGHRRCIPGESMSQKRRQSGGKHGRRRRARPWKHRLFAARMGMRSMLIIQQ